MFALTLTQMSTCHVHILAKELIKRRKRGCDTPKRVTPLKMADYCVLTLIVLFKIIPTLYVELITK